MWTNDFRDGVEFFFNILCLIFRDSRPHSSNMMGDNSTRYETQFSLLIEVYDPVFFIHHQIPGADDLAAEGGVPLLHCLPSTGWPGLQSPKSSQTSGNHDYINISKLKRVLSNFLFIATCNLSAALKHCK